MTKKTLILEGSNDKHVVFQICNKHKLAKFDAEREVIEAGSKDTLLSELKTYLKSNIGSRIGILIDADENPKGTWDSIRNTINSMKLGYELPDIFPTEGLVVTNRASPLYPILGVWIMPDNDTTGTIEHFLRYLIKEEDAHKLKLADDCIEVLEAKDGAFIKNENHRAKVLLHTFLAWQDDPGQPPGVAISKKYLAPTCPQALSFVTWLKAVFFNEI